MAYIKDRISFLTIPITEAKHFWEFQEQLC